MTKQTKAEATAERIANLTGVYKENLKDEKVVDGVIKKDISDTFDANLPEGLTPELVSSLSTYVGDTVVAVHTVCGDLAVRAMAADKEIDKVTGDFSFGTIGGMKSAITRSLPGRNPSTGEETLTLASNRVTVDIFTPAGAPFNASKAAIKALGVEMLS